jgi:hypothetical protein
LVQAPRKTLFDDFHHHRGIAHFRFGNKQMKMFRHHDISVCDETVLAARFFENSLKGHGVGQYAIGVGGGSNCR